jgi:hypothetical protein
MLPALFHSFRYPIEFALFLALIFFVPLFEVPKNLLFGAYVIAWVVNRHQAGWKAGCGGRWDAWDSLFFIWIASAYLLASFAGLHKNEWHAIGDLWRYRVGLAAQAAATESANGARSVQASQCRPGRDPVGLAADGSTSTRGSNCTRSDTSITAPRTS